LKKELPECRTFRSGEEHRHLDYLGATFGEMDSGANGRGREGESIVAIKYDEVVPWGRSFEEYCRMFDFSADDLNKKICGCGDGPASFNAICTSKGGTVVSVDPVYCLTKAQMVERIRATYETVLDQTRKNQDKFVWSRIKSLDDLGEVRMKAMNEFLADYEPGKESGRYREESLPKLSFPDNSFDIVLSAHFLFFYSDNLTYEFHRESIFELLRIAPEARIFPVVDLNAKKSGYLERIMRELHEFHFEIKKVDYEFQVGGNELMIVTRKK
jgi:hypothetical protein